MPDTPPLITFVVLCYNTEEYVEECVRSVLDQGDAFAWEMIAVDDCSTDRTAEILFSFRDPRIRIIAHAVNVGPQASIDEAMYAARGKFVARIDSDDRYRANFLADLIPLFGQHPAVGMVYGDAAIMNRAGEIVAGCATRPCGSLPANDFLALLEENFICAPTMIARREAWLKCLPIPKHMALADWYCNVLISREYETYHLPRVVADYRVHPNNFHTQIVADARHETSVVSLLNAVFSSTEQDPEMEQQKQRARRRIYSAQYSALARKYFGIGMNADARRCYVMVFRYELRCLFSRSQLRLFAATFIRRAWYDNGKRVWKQFTRAAA